MTDIDPTIEWDPNTITAIIDEVTPAALPERWWQDHDEIVRLAYWMLEHHSEARDIVLMVEKPWKFEDEYRQALADNAAEEAEAMHRLPGESYLAMLYRNRTKTPSVSFGTESPSGALGTSDA